jgi:tetratricopeptide (TPR) repeat protein
LLLYELQQARGQVMPQRAWHIAIQAGVVAAGFGDAGHVATATSLLTRSSTAYTPGDVYLGPSAPALLAVRAARRAVAQQPDDDEGWLRLAEATYYLWRKQENRCADEPLSLPMHPQRVRHQLATRNQRLGLRQLIRAAQVLYALDQALVLRPDDVLFHKWLAEVYWQLGYFDLALHQQREVLRLARAQSPTSGDSAEQIKQQVARLEQLTQEFEREVERLRSDYQSDSMHLPPLFQARRACYTFGLVQEALNALGQADIAGSTEALELFVYLALTTGRIDSLVEGDPLHRPQQLRVSYKQRLDDAKARGVTTTGGDFYQAILSAAVGDYGQSGAALERVLAAVSPETSSAMPVTLTGLAINQLQPNPWTRAAAVVGWKNQIEPQLSQGLTNSAQQREGQVVRGLLALEEGDTALATAQFRQAVRAEGTPVAIESLPIARSYLDKLPK